MKKRLILGIAVVLVAAVVVGAIAIRQSVQTYLRSDAFRAMVSGFTSRALGVRGDFAPFQWAGSSVYSEDFQATGREGTRLSDFSASRIRAELNWRAAFEGEWRIDRLDVGQARILLGATQPPEDAARADEAAPAAAAMPKLPGFVQAWLPKRVNLAEVVVADGNIVSEGSGEFALKRSEWTIRPSGNGWEISAKQGSLNVAQYPTLSLESARARFQGGIWFLTHSLLRTEREGVLKVDGEWDPEKTTRLRVGWEQVPLERWIPEKWRPHASAIAAGQATVEGKSTDLATWTVSGDFTLTDGQIHDFAFLDQIATFTQAQQYRRLSLQKVQGRFEWKQGAWKVERFVAESRGLFKVEGTFHVSANGDLSGTLDVGVTGQSLQWLPGSRERVFTVARDGYLWTPVKVAGTVERPTEDLSGRLVTAGAQEVITKPIDSAPAAVRDAAERAIEVLTPFLR